MKDAVPSQYVPPAAQPSRLFMEKNHGSSNYHHVPTVAGEDELPRKYLGVSNQRIIKKETWDIPRFLVADIDLGIVCPMFYFDLCLFTSFLVRSLPPSKNGNSQGPGTLVMSRQC